MKYKNHNNYGTEKKNPYFEELTLNLKIEGLENIKLHLQSQLAAGKCPSIILQVFSMELNLAFFRRTLHKPQYRRRAIAKNNYTENVIIFSNFYFIKMKKKNFFN